MIRKVYAADGTFVREEDAEPECGEDFCDECGDCLHCYGGDSCTEEGGHRWVVCENQSSMKSGKE